MTDLLSRPSTAASSGAASGYRSGVLSRLTGRSGRRPDPEPSLVPRAALAGLLAAAGTMVGCMAVALVGWFLADAGAHGETTDALRVGAGMWLAAHGSGIWVGGVPLGIIPLALTAVVVLVAFRAARRAGRQAPGSDDAGVLVGAMTFTGIYVIVGLVAALVAGTGQVSASVGRTALGTLVLAGLAGTCGLAAGTGLLAGWIDRVPGWIRAVIRGALATVGLLLAASSLLFVGALAWGIGDAATMLSALHLQPGDYVAYLLACVVLVPNAVVFAAAWLLGPGFAVGTATVVSPTAVALGPMPAFPLLAALPDGGPMPSWLGWVVVVPVACAIGGAVHAQRSYAVTAYDSAALRGFGSGIGAALLIALLALLAGGPMGTGRLAVLGPSAGEVVVAAVMTMSLAGLVAGVVTAGWQRRGADRVRD